MVSSAAKNRYGVYERAYCRLLDKYKANPGLDAKGAMKKLIFLGVKKLIMRPDRKSFTQEEAESDLQETEIILACMRLLTPEEFIRLFPITKDFRGRRLQFKDYFYSRDYVQKLPQSEPIGDEVLHFIWEYANNDITDFSIYLMGCLSNLRKLEGLPSLAQEWAENNGLKTYTMHADNKGRKYLLDRETGKSIRIKQRRHLKIVKK